MSTNVFANCRDIVRRNTAGVKYPVRGHKVCVCVLGGGGFIPFILDVRLVDVPAGVTQEEGHTGFLHLPSAVLALIFIARRIQPSLSLADRVVKC